MDIETRTMLICLYLEEARQLTILISRRNIVPELAKILKNIEEAMKIAGCRE